MFVVSDWTVKVVTGRRTQTVNLRPRDSTDPAHSWIVRLRAPRFVTEYALIAKGFTNAEALVRYLEDQLGGSVERSPGFDTAAAPGFAPEPAAEALQANHVVDGDAWSARVEGIVEHAIDQLVIRSEER